MGYFMCTGKDLNLRSRKATDLQSVVIDRSTTRAYRVILSYFYQISKNIGAIEGI